MDEFITQAIAVRKSTLMDAYIINDAAFMSDLDALIAQMTQLGETCADAAAFETAFATSPLSEQYIQLCGRAAGNFQVRSVIRVEEPTTAEKVGEVTEWVSDRAAARLDSATQPARYAAREAARQEIESIPVIGKAAEVARLTNWSAVKGWFKKDDEETEE